MLITFQVIPPAAASPSAYPIFSFSEAIDYVVVFICANIVNKLDFSGNIAYICRQICGRARSAVRQLKIPEIY